jgi:hypothetical protein
MDECTTDSCDPNLGCINVWIDCNDNDETTYDYCDINAGCLHVAQGHGY